MLLASCCEDDIVPHVLPFVTERIKSPDWRFRDAAVMAFGEIPRITFDVGTKIDDVQLIDFRLNIRRPQLRHIETYCGASYAHIN